jgi:hypothetical protein
MDVTLASSRIVIFVLIVLGVNWAIAMLSVQRRSSCVTMRHCFKGLEIEMENDFLLNKTVDDYFFVSERWD